MTDLLAVLTLVVPPSVVLLTCRYVNTRTDREAVGAVSGARLD